MDAFFAMGGYAAYVWPAYAVSIVVLAGAVVLTRLSERRIQRSLAELEGRDL
jgi:heme exporter protein D